MSPEVSVGYPAIFKKSIFFLVHGGRGEKLTGIKLVILKPASLVDPDDSKIPVDCVVVRYLMVFGVGQNQNHGFRMACSVSDYVS
jgi:hypothetical protein